MKTKKVNDRIGTTRTATVAIILIVVFVTATAALYYESLATKKTSAPLILYSADAYDAETIALENAFTQSTGIQTVTPKSGGALTLGQEIAQGDPVSVFISVSKTAVSRSVLNTTFSGWALAFATDQMVIAYSNATAQNSPAKLVLSSYVGASSQNTTFAWNSFFSNLTSGSVKVGISNPNADPAGFRGWLVLEAAGALFHDNSPSFYSNQISAEHGNVTGASAADLVTPLVSGNIQFLFIYKSAALAAHLNILVLPNSINLGDPAYSSFYSEFSYPTTTGLETGSVIELLLSVPSDATDLGGSLDFASFVVHSAPSALSGYGLGFLMPAQLYNDSVVPSQINALLVNGSLTESGSL